MRVVLAARFFFSGQTTHVVELARELARSGHRVAVLTTARGHVEAWRAYQAPLAEVGVVTERVDDSAGMGRFCQAFAPDVLHVHSSDLIGPCSELCDACGIPVVVTAHGLGVAENAPRIHRVHAVIAVGGNVRADLHRAGLRRVVVITNGVDTDRFSPDGFSPGGRVELRRGVPSPITIAYVGRIDALKRRGLVELIEAVALLPGARLLLASNERVNRPHVTSLGWQVDVAPLMAKSHVVVGTGRAVREGLAAGRVAMLLGEAYGGVVSPEHPGTRQGDGDGYGFSARAGRPPRREEIRRDLIRVLQAESHYRGLCRWGRAFALRHFSLKAMAAAVTRVYAAALEGAYVD